MSVTTAIVRTIWVAIFLTLLGPTAAADEPSPSPAPAVLNIGQYATRWPTVLPCAHPQALQASDALVWRAQSGQPLRALASPQLSEGTRLDGAFPVGQLDLLVGFRRAALLLACGPDAGASSPYIEWSACMEQGCTLSVAYHTERPRRAQRTLGWLKRSSHWRFFVELAARNRPAETLAAARVTFAHDMAADLRDLVQGLCSDGRCSDLVRLTGAAGARFADAGSLEVRDTAAPPAVGEQRSFNDSYQWVFAGTEGAHAATVDCEIVAFGERPSLVRCYLSLPLDDDHTVRFEAATGTLEVDGSELLGWYDAQLIMTEKALALRRL